MADSHKCSCTFRKRSIFSAVPLIGTAESFLNEVRLVDTNVNAILASMSPTMFANILMNVPFGHLQLRQLTLVFELVLTLMVVAHVTAQLATFSVKLVSLASTSMNTMFSTIIVMPTESRLKEVSFVTEQTLKGVPRIQIQKLPVVSTMLFATHVSTVDSY